MSETRHERVGRLFLCAAELSGAEREVFLAAECGGDSALREEIEVMLAMDRSDRPLRALQAPLWSPTGDQPMPERIGPFAVVRRIGAGSMGVVYEARQERPQRSVALKVLRWPQDPELLARFEREAELLGRLQHPAIAQVHAAGLAHTGQVREP